MIFSRVRKYNLINFKFPLERLMTIQNEGYNKLKDESIEYADMKSWIAHSEGFFCAIKHIVKKMDEECMEDEETFCNLCHSEAKKIFAMENGQLPAEIEGAIDFVLALLFEGVA